MGWFSDLFKGKKKDDMADGQTDGQPEMTMPSEEKVVPDMPTSEDAVSNGQETMITPEETSTEEMPQQPEM